MFTAPRIRRLRQWRAIKLLSPALAEDPDAVMRFRREAQAVITELMHPNIVKTYDLLREGDEFYLVMELVHGCDLAQLVDQGGPMPMYEAVQVIEQVAAGLAFAHDRGFVHRDIKPHNLILATDGSVKILDFGLVSAVTRVRFAGQTQSFCHQVRSRDIHSWDEIKVDRWHVTLHASGAIGVSP